MAVKIDTWKKRSGSIFIGDLTGYFHLPRSTAPTATILLRPPWLGKFRNEISFRPPPLYLDKPPGNIDGDTIIGRARRVAYSRR